MAATDAKQAFDNVTPLNLSGTMRKQVGGRYCASKAGRRVHIFST